MANKKKGRSKQLKKNRAKRQAKRQAQATQASNVRKKNARRAAQKGANTRTFERFNDQLSGAFDSPLAQAKARVFLQFTKPMWQGQANENRISTVMEEVAKQQSQQYNRNITVDDISLSKMIDAVWKQATEGERDSAIKEAENEITLTYYDTDSPEWQKAKHELDEDYPEYKMSGHFVSASSIASLIYKVK